MRPTIALALGLASLFGVSCRNSPTSSAVRIVNGTSDDGDKYKAVVHYNINGDGDDCTGTFVTATTLLTAAHCVYSARSPDAVTLDGQAAEKILPNDKFHNSDGLDDWPYDMALVRFPAGSAPEVATFAAQAPKVGDADTIVGFGVTDLSRDVGFGTRRSGTNTIKQLLAGLIVTEGPSRTSGDDGHAISGSGDSGGPMLVGGGIVGVCSGALGDGNASGPVPDAYVSVFSSAAQAFFAQAATAGFDLPDVSALKAVAASADQGTLVDQTQIDAVVQQFSGSESSASNDGQD